jgi:hypothetical protein
MRCWARVHIMAGESSSRDDGMHSTISSESSFINQKIWVVIWTRCKVHLMLSTSLSQCRSSQLTFLKCKLTF